VLVHDTDWRRPAVALQTGVTGGRPICKIIELTAITTWLGHSAIARTGFFVLSSVFKERRRQEARPIFGGFGGLKPLASAPRNQ